MSGTQAAPAANRYATTRESTTPRALLVVFVAVFLVAVFLLLWSAALRKDLNHDENMYVASGALLLREGLLPYRDYPYFQMPLLTFVYAGLFSLGDHLLLIARTFSVVCATASVGMLCWAGYSAFGRRDVGVRLAAGVAAAVLFVTSPITEYASGIAWNHDLPVLLSLGAFAALKRGVDKDFALWWLAASGVLVGLAAEARLTFALLALPMAVAIVVLGRERGGRMWRALAEFIAGGIVAALPSLILLLLAPDRFVFGNLGYHSLNAIYWQILGYTRAMTLSSKLSYLWEIAKEPGTMALLGGVLITGIAALAISAKTDRNRTWGVLSLACALVLLVGSLAPSPTWYQYFFAVVPFLVVGMVFFAGCVARTGKPAWPLIVPVAAAVLCAFYDTGAYRDGSILPRSADWLPEKVHKIGIEVGSGAGAGRVLTLSPLYPLEGGASIYPRLETGPFGWRVAPLVPGDERNRYGIPEPGSVESVLQNQTPTGVLTGAEPGLESPFLEYARRVGLKQQTLSGGLTLWLPDR